MIVNTSEEAVKEISDALKRAKRILAEIRDQSNYMSPLRDCKHDQIQESLNRISKRVDEAARIMEASETRLWRMAQGIADY